MLSKVLRKSSGCLLELISGCLTIVSTAQGRVIQHSSLLRQCQGWAGISTFAAMMNCRKQQVHFANDITPGANMPQMSARLISSAGNHYGINQGHLWSWCVCQLCAMYCISAHNVRNLCMDIDDCLQYCVPQTMLSAHRCQFCHALHACIPSRCGCVSNLRRPFTIAMGQQWLLASLSAGLYNGCKGRPLPTGWSASSNSSLCYGAHSCTCCNQQLQTAAHHILSASSVVHVCN